MRSEFVKLLTAFLVGFSVMCVLTANTGASNGTNTAPGDPQFCNNAKMSSTVLNDAGFPVVVPSLQSMVNAVNLALDAGNWACDGGNPACDGGPSGPGTSWDPLQQRVSVRVCNTAENGGSSLIKCCVGEEVLYPDAGIVDAGPILGDAGPLTFDAGPKIVTVFDAGYPDVPYDAGPCPLVNPDAGFVDGGPFVYGYAWQGNGMGATPIFVLATANVNIVDGGSSFCDGGNFCDGGSPFIWVNLYTGDAGPSCLADGGPISFTYDAGPLILTQCDGGMSQGCMATYTVGINDGGPLYWDAGPQCLAQYGGQDPAFGASNPGDAIGVGFCITYNAGSGAPILCVPQQVNADVTTLECNSN